MYIILDELLESRSEKVFNKYYVDLTNVSFIDDLSPEFVSAELISIDQEEAIRNTPTSREKAIKFLHIISQDNCTRNFFGMLDIMESRGKMAVAHLARKIKSELYQTQPYVVKQDLFSFSDQQQQQLQHKPNLSTDDIMSLYNVPAQPQYSSYTANPFSTYHQQHQQEAALNMAQHSQQQLMGVSAMQAQIANLNVQEGQSMVKMNEGIPLQPQPQHAMLPSQALNPNPWLNFDAFDSDYKANY